jgi:hypothetical protein
LDKLKTAPQAPLFSSRWFPQTDAGAAAILINKLDPRFSQYVLDRLERLVVADIPSNLNV